MSRHVDSLSGMYLLLATVLVCLATSMCQANPFLRDIARSGNEAYQAEDYPRAAQEYLKAQDLEPLSAQLRYNLGSAYCRQNEFDKAVEEFTEATRADDPKTAAVAYYNLGNAKYQGAKRTFEAGMVAGATQQAQSQQGDPVQVYVKKLEECIGDYQETLKRTPDDTDAKFNIEAIRREIKNLMRRQQQNPQQNQQQNQDQKDQQQNQDQQNKDQQQNQDQKQDQQKQDQQKQDQQKQDQQKQDQQQQQNQQGEQGTPTPQPMAQMPTATPTGSQGENKSQDQQQPTAEPTQMLSISEEMARNLLDNLPEQRPRVRSKQRQKSEKDW